MKQVIAYIITNDLNEILLQKRTADYRFSKQWTLFGGHIEKNEDPLETAKRELKEELDLDLRFCDKFISDLEPLEEVYLFKGKLNDLSKISLKEGNGFAFFALDEIDDLNSPNKYSIKKYG